MTREKAIEILKRKTTIPNDGEDFDDISDAFDMAIKALSSSENPNKWIPVETALPEVGSQVLVCYEYKKKRYMYIADFYGDGKFHGLDYDWVDDAIAWMPLPTPPNKSEIPTGAERE